MNFNYDSSYNSHNLIYDLRVLFRHYLHALIRTRFFDNDNDQYFSIDQFFIQKNIQMTLMQFKSSHECVERTLIFFNTVLYLTIHFCTQCFSCNRVKKLMKRGVDRYVNYFCVWLKIAWCEENQHGDNHEWC